MRKRGNKQKAGLVGKTAIEGSWAAPASVLGSGWSGPAGEVTEQTRAAAAVKSSPGGARAEAPPPRGSRPAPPAGSTAAETNTHTKADPAPTPSGWLKRCFIRCPWKWTSGGPSGRRRKNPLHAVWRCEGRENECRGGTTKDLAVSAGKKERERERNKWGPRKWQRRISSQPSWNPIGNKDQAQRFRDENKHKDCILNTLSV